MIHQRLGILGGPLVAAFTMGIVFPFANQKGVISGALSGCIFGWVIFFGSKADPKSVYLKNAIPSTIELDKCHNPDWEIDIRNFTERYSAVDEASDFCSCAAVAQQFCEAKRGENLTMIVDDTCVTTDWFEFLALKTQNQI